MAIFHTGDEVIYDGNDALLRRKYEAGSTGVVQDKSDNDYSIDGEDALCRVLFSDGISQLVSDENLFSANRSIYKVERKVDTVIVEMDVHVAEMLVTVLNEVSDWTRGGMSFIGSPLWQLRQRLVGDAGVRYPSPLYKARVTDDCLSLTDAI